MTTSTDGYQAGIDAVIADNTLNRGGFIDAIQTELPGVGQNAAGDWVDAIATELNRLGIINNPTYGNLRGNIIDDPIVHRALFDALATLGQLDELNVVQDVAELQNLREDRDNINDAIDRLDVLIAAEPAGPSRRLVREVLRQGKDILRNQKETIRQRIQQITGDPDS